MREFFGTLMRRKPLAGALLPTLRCAASAVQLTAQASAVAIRESQQNHLKRSLGKIDLFGYFCCFCLCLLSRVVTVTVRIDQLTRAHPHTSSVGIGSTIGAGIFVLTGVAARNLAGPAVCLSFLFAGFSIVFSALCYAELASRVPVSGSAYSYSTFVVGEFAAFLIGWNLTLELSLFSLFEL